MTQARQRSAIELNALRLVLAIVLAGSVIGVVGALFHKALRSADTARVALISLAEQSLFPSWLAAVIACLLGAALAAWLANRFAPDSPQSALAASGEGPVRPVADLGRFGTNFAGASLAVGAGLALGPERPAIQLGAVIGRTIIHLVGLVRFVLGPLSLAASTPGGYFTPVLLLGATFGSMVGGLASLGLPASDVTPTAFAVVGMAVALASVANAPFTGILLVIETTGAAALSLPMTVAVLGAMGVDRLLKQPFLTHGLEIALRPRKGTGDSPCGRPAA